MHGSGVRRDDEIESAHRVVEFLPAGTPDQVMRWTRARALTGLNLIDVWGLYAEQPVLPELVNPDAAPRGGGIGVVMAGQNARSGGFCAT